MNSITCEITFPGFQGAPGRDGEAGLPGTPGLKVRSLRHTVTLHVHRSDSESLKSRTFWMHFIALFGFSQVEAS